MANPKAKYCPLSDSELLDKEEQLVKLWQVFLQKNERSGHSAYAVNRKLLYDIIERVDERKDYYYYFHKIDNMSELKEVALTGFWLVKLKPFRMEDPLSDLYSWENENFALYLILSILHKELPRRGHKFKLPSEQFMKNVRYSLKYRDISKEAMIDLV